MNANTTTLRTAVHTSKPRRIAGNSYHPAFDSHDVITFTTVDVTDTDEGRERLAKHDEIAEFSNWRQVMADTATEYTVRVTKTTRKIATTFTHDDGTSRTCTRSDDELNLEVVTAHGVLCVGLFKGRYRLYESIGGFVSSTKKMGALLGTWRKRGHVVGHHVAWAESFTWTARRATAVKRTAKALDKKAGEADALVMATRGVTYARTKYVEADRFYNDTYVRPAVQAVYESMHKVGERRRVQHAHDELAALGGKAA